MAGDPEMNTQRRHGVPESFTSRENRDSPRNERSRADVIHHILPPPGEMVSPQCCQGHFAKDMPTGNAKRALNE